MSQIVDGENYLEEVKALILEYVEFLGRDLAFQNLQAELDDLRSKYTAPNGRLLVALSDAGRVVGCVAYYRHGPTRCEMKRLYVKPEYRTLRLGSRLVAALIDAAQAEGYQEMVLDTVRELQSAIHMYEQHGFVETAPYYANPMPDVIYMKRAL